MREQTSSNIISKNIKIGIDNYLVLCYYNWCLAVIIFRFTYIRIVYFTLN